MKPPRPSEATTKWNRNSNKGITATTEAPEHDKQGLESGYHSHMFVTMENIGEIHAQEIYRGIHDNEEHYARVIEDSKHQHQKLKVK